MPENHKKQQNPHKNSKNDKIHRIPSENGKHKQNRAKMPAPWTRLGYTYDWGASQNHIGLSEFVLRKGANLEVDSVTAVNDYCRGGDSIATIQ